MRRNYQAFTCEIYSFGSVYHFNFPALEFPEFFLVICVLNFLSNSLQTCGQSCGGEGGVKDRGIPEIPRQIFLEIIFFHGYQLKKLNSQSSLNSINFVSSCPNIWPKYQGKMAYRTVNARKMQTREGQSIIIQFRLYKK